MTIHDTSYRRYQGQRRPPGRGWLVIAETGIRAVLARRGLLLLLLFAWAPFTVRAVQLFLPTLLPGAEDCFGPTVRMYRSFMDDQFIFAFFVTLFVGARQVAEDRRANALSLYLSHPLTRFEYVAGKSMVVSFFLLLVTWLPGILLLLLQSFLEGNLTFLRENAFLFPAVSGVALVEIVLCTSLILALSSLTRSGRFAALLFAAAYLLPRAAFHVLRAITHDSGLSWISFRALVEQVGDVFFRLEPRYETPVGISVLVMLLLVAASAAVLARRVRSVEVVK
jgi:hypothetical protein